MLPVRLPIGMVSIYNAGASLNEIISETENQFIRFGVIDNLYSIYGGLSIGQSAMFDTRDAKPLFYIDNTFYILPANKISIVENPVVIDP